MSSILFMGWSGADIMRLDEEERPGDNRGVKYTLSQSWG